MTLPLRTVILALAAAAALGCGSTEPTHRNLELARDAWIATNALDYSFNLTTRSMLPASEYRVTVTDRTNVTATNADGEPVPQWQLTIDGIWEHILAARAQGELHDAIFDSRGVPVESNMGRWELDGGVAFSVRSFVKTR